MSRTDVARTAHLVARQLAATHPWMLIPAVMALVAMLAAAAVIAIVAALATVPCGAGAGALVCLRRAYVAAVTWRRRTEVAS